MFSSDKIFKPLNTIEQEVKKYEYAPFHALANYISEQGYAGIIFRSTVHENGTNLVLFEPNDTSVIHNSMEYINTSDYL
nr:RES family NAD+ phosphorylase [Peribacillus frigoritolerans]